MNLKTYNKNRHKVKDSAYSATEQLLHALEGKKSIDSHQVCDSLVDLAKNEDEGFDKIIKLFDTWIAGKEIDGMKEPLIEFTNFLSDQLEEPESLVDTLYEYVIGLKLPKVDVVRYIEQWLSPELLDEFTSFVLNND